MKGPVKQLKLRTSSLAETLSLGSRLGANLKGQEVIELLSDLGGGKTSLVKGIAAGAGSNELVSSPSFTICNEYKARKLTIYHFDFYRLSDPGIIRRELAEAMDAPASVVILEWPEVLEDTLPTSRLVIEITADSPTTRTFKLSFPANFSYLVKGLK